MLASAVVSLALLRAPPLRLSDGHGAARSALQVRMAASAEPKATALGKFQSLNTMNKMTTVKKGAKPRLRGKRLPPAMVELTGRFKKQALPHDAWP